MKIKRSLGNDRYHEVVEYGDLVYLAGLTSDKGKKGIAEQTRDVLRKIEERLALAGSDKNHMLRATIFLKTMQDFAGMNEIWVAWLEKGHAPARTTVEARMVSEDILVEIMVDAAKT